MIGTIEGSSRSNIQSSVMGIMPQELSDAVVGATPVSALAVLGVDANVEIVDAEGEEDDEEEGGRTGK